MKPSIQITLTFLCLLLRLGSASADTYKLPGDIGSGPFSSCTGTETPFYCNSNVKIGVNKTLILESNVTLDINGEFKVADDSSVNNNGYVFNVTAKKLHIDGSASMIFDNLTATGDVHIHKQANLTANVTSTSGKIKIDDGNNTINGNITAYSGNLTINSGSTVNGTCSPSRSQCTPPMLNPTVISQTTYGFSVIISGTYSSSVASSLNVTVNSVTYSLSTSSQLTNSSDSWTLDLSSITPLPLDTYQVVATSTDNDGSLSDNTIDELVIIEYSADWWNTNWTKCRDITIANTGTTTLSNFPAYIDLPYDSDMQSNYNDIRFINTSCANGGFELDFEIEKHTGTSADVWVEIDSLPAEGKTIAVYYGNSSAPSGEDIPGTWNISHKGVWHLRENTGATNKDSTSNTNTGTPLNSPASTSLGKIGNALDFSGTDTNVTLGKPDSLELSQYNDWTISLWVKPFSDFADNSYPTMYTYGDYRASVGIADGSEEGKIEIRRNDKDPIYSNSIVTIGVWNHVVVTRDNNGTYIYLNGELDTITTNKTINSDIYASYIGGYAGYTEGDLIGIIDEVRVSNESRTPDWIKQSYDLVQDQGDHVTIGDEGDATPLIIVAGRATLKNTASSPEFTSVCFDTPFPEAPLVFSLPTTADDDDRLALRIRNVTSTGFEIAQVESPVTTDENVPEPAGNVSQTVDFLAIPEGDYTLDDGSKMSVSSLSTNEFQGDLTGGSQGWVTISTADLGFSQAPAIIASIQTMNNEADPFPISTPFLATAVSDVDNTKFNIALERGETSSGVLDNNETIGFIAITPGSGELTADISYESFRTSENINTGQNTCRAFNLNTYNNNPLVIASQNTRKGGDGGWLKRCSITTSSVGFSIVEDQANDAEGNHTNERAGGVALGGTFADMTCNTVNLHHYRIEHDAQGFTCEAETLTIKACADANCDTLYDQETSITLSPSGWAGSNTIIFTGEMTTSLSVTDEGTVTLAKTSAIPDVGLRCFNGNTETCDITFSDDGFEIYGANIGDLLPDQLAANNFLNVNVRAVRSNNNVCEALLEGTQEINLSYDCVTPDTCLTPLNGINIAGDGSGESTGNIDVEFDALGVASLAVLNYPDAGRLTLQVRADVDGVTITNSDIETVDVYPSYLQLAVEQEEVVYGNSGAQNNYIAAEPFALSIGAYGVNDVLLPNYQAETPQLKVTRIQPASLGSDGRFKYSNTGINTASPAADFTTATGLTFSGGEHQYTAAYYDEVGRINVDVKDSNYLGNIIASSGSLTLGDFYPGYFDVSVSSVPSLANTCGVFSYIGEVIGFATDPELTVSAYNALDQITNNYSDTHWNYLPDEATLEANLSYLDSSTYTLTGTASEIDLGDTPIVTNNTDYDGTGTVTINNGLFQYNKVDTDNSTFAIVSPFDGSINLVFASGFFTTPFTGQGGSNTICYRDSYASASCNSLSIENVIGTKIHYGRISLSSTYGPETESLAVPIHSEYYDTGKWLLNSADNCTSIAFEESASHMELLQSGSTDITGNINTISSTGKLLLGVADDGNDLLLNAPDTMGEVKLQLDPNHDATGWSDYLNYDWNADGFINADDHPEATVTFGQFRGSDRIIHWREVFN